VQSEVIGAFNEYLDAAKDKQKILDFVEQQLESKSPKNRKMAKEFLKRGGK
jgi:hypothetical protein